MTKKAKRRDIIIAVIGVLGLMLTTTNFASAQSIGTSNVIRNSPSQKSSQRMANHKKPARSTSFRKERSESRNHKNREAWINSR